ncbi:MAG: transporter, partial [Flavobacteriaceae bacterium]|nr:transporter [Flavobacteriaceae bacterium]
MNAFKTYFISCLALAFTTLAFGQYTEVINSNRPGVSRSAFSVGTNVLQLEVGPYIIKEEHTPLQYDVDGFGTDFSIRYGLFLEQLEINVEGTFQSDTYTDYRSNVAVDNKRSNFKHLTIGAKYLVYDPYKNSEDDKPNLYSYHANRKFKWKSLIPAVSVYIGGNFDTKSNPYTAPDVEGFSPKVMIASQNNFNGGWVFVINLVKDRIGNDFSDFQYIVTLTKSVGQ